MNDVFREHIEITRAMLDHIDKPSTRMACGELDELLALLADEECEREAVFALVASAEAFLRMGLD